ncbi:MAG TPA: FecR family protein [Cytophagales bacterium]|nr:FecR family protein [Cytophagales bacterium]
MSILKSIYTFTLVFIISFIITACSTKTVKTTEGFEIINLPDNSIIYLNKNSSIKYNDNFKTREIELSGEAYFDVTSGESPFIIKTPLAEIKVLGTEFNIRSIGEQLEVEVEKGVVELKANQETNTLKRGERALYNKSKNLIQRGKANFKFKIWMNDLKKEFKSLSKDFAREGKKAGKEFKKIGKDIKKEINK